MTPKPANGEHRPPLRRVVLASVAGNMLEWYDFFLFGAAAALIFGKLFFPVGGAPIVGMLAAFASYAVGFAARPIGGIVFGHMGDRRGRKTALIWTLSLMGVATFAMGLLPTYEQIGPLAPILLVALRILQGIAAGGEWGGGVLMITENAPARRRGFLGAWSQTGVGLGFVLASAALYAAQLLPEQDFLSWGWRLPFLASIMILFVGLFIRRRIPESSEFRESAAEDTGHAPFLQLLKRHPRETLIAIGVRLAENGGSHIMLTFALAYGAEMGVAVDIMLLGVVLAMLADSLMMPVFGALSDRFGRRPVYLFGAVSLALFIYPFFVMLGSGDTAAVIAALMIGNGLCHAAMIGVQPAMFSEMFSVSVRYSGLAAAHEVSSMIVGFGPLLATALYAHYRSPVPVAIYLIVLCTITVAALFAAGRTDAGRPAQR